MMTACDLENFGRWLLKLVFAIACMLPWSMARADTPTEYDVKLAFIHNMINFIEWPTPSPDTIRLCIVGDNPFRRAADMLRDTRADGPSWSVSHLAGDDSMKECNVLFISASEANNLARILDATRNSSVLTIGDSAGYAASGVIVNFYLDTNKVRFEINTKAAQKAHLRIGSQLLKLARIVGEGSMR